MGKKDLTTEQRNVLVQFLLEESINGKPKFGKMKEATLKFGVHQRTVSRLWAAAKIQKDNGEAIHLSSKKVMKPRGRRKHIDLALISSLPLRKRASIRCLAKGIKISRGTIGRWIKQGLIRAHTSAIRPDLTTANKLSRLRFSLDALELDNIMNVLKFKNMDNTIHIDEKWFYLTKVKRRYYLIPAEEEPHRTCKNKKFICKVMFVCAVCRPLFDTDGSTLFDGKIGIWPLTQQVPAKRNSKNRSAGTLETKPLDSITRDVMRDNLINQMVPAIMTKWPTFASKVIYIQQDNAKPHILDGDLKLREAATRNGFNISLVQQPPNSPDTNINDLGWFRALQSEQEQNVCTTVDQLVDAVLDSYDKLTAETLDNVFLSLQGCMVEIMKSKGGNGYKLPHMGKDALRRAGELPRNLEVPKELVRECITYLDEAGSLEGIEALKNRLGLNRLEEQ